MPVQLIPGLPENVVGLVAEGKVTADDYTAVIDPAIDAALASHDKLRLLYVLGADFTGFSGGAAWEDGKLGMRHLTKWEMIAVVTDQTWIGHSVNVFGHLMPGKVKTFSLAERDEAREWIVG